MALDVATSHRSSRPSSGSKPVRRILAGLIVLAAAAVARDPGPPPVAPVALDSFDEIRATGTLKVITRRGYTSWFDDNSRHAGFNHDLMRGFAKEIGARVEFTVADTPAELTARLLDGEFHIGVGALDTSGVERIGLRSSGPIVEREFVLVQHRDAPELSSLGELAGRDIVVPSGAFAVGLLQAITETHPLVLWRTSTTADTEKLLRAVGEGRLAYTIADTDTLTAMRQHLPALRVAHRFEARASTAWAFHTHSDVMLRVAASKYLENMHRHGEVARLAERYFEPAQKGSTHDLRVFRQRIIDTLPAYRHLFVEAGVRFGVDWRLLAALSYQESKWNPSAVSYTGVRGIMQLTKATARTFDVDREDVPEAITAAARYMKLLEERLPESIDSTDRMWMALASYNIGPGHLDDARELTTLYGGNADRWPDVQRHLPLLGDRDYTAHLKYGTARGGEAVHLVTRVRSFYDVLVKKESSTSDYVASPIYRRPTRTTTIL